MSLKRLLLFSLLLMLPALAVACGGGQSGCDVGDEDDASAIRSTIDCMFDAAGDGDWRDMHDLMSTNYRDRCPFEEFDRLAERSQEAITNRSLRDVEDIRVVGDQAEATVVVEISGSRISGTFVFVREDGTWRHDPPDGLNSACEGVF
jgi:hypothetical protein